eukprot:15359089-Alexandrium_andersonii.AAC.1
MSASLVGSEMCIRDRRQPLGWALWLGVSNWAACRPWRGLFGPSARLRPVSYTHLTLPTICSV